VTAFEAILLWYERKPVDLIIADVIMPGVNGPLLVEAIWDEEYTPVLYISGLAPRGLAARHIQDGRARFLAAQERSRACRGHIASQIGGMKAECVKGGIQRRPREAVVWSRVSFAL